MNVPFSPIWLWPVVVGMVMGAFLWRRWQRSAMQTSAADDGLNEAPRTWRRARLLPWLLGVLGIVGAYALWRFSAPSMHGVVVDAATGRPISGAMVARKVFREAQVSLTESPGVFTEPRSLVETRTDAKGRFRLPGFVSLIPVGILGESGMAWKVFASDYMIAGGCEVQGFPAADGCGAEGGFEHPDSWAVAASQRRFGAVRLEVRLRPPELGPGDPWGEYFRRLNNLTQFRYLSVERFVDEAVDFAKNHELTLVVRNEFAQVRGSLGYALESGGYYKPGLALRLLAIEEQFCLRHPATRGCDLKVLSRDRGWLEERVRPNRR